MNKIQLGFLFLLIPIKYIFRFILRLIRDTDGFLTWVCSLWLPKQPLLGQCKRRGVCCQHIAVGLPSISKRLPFMVHVINFWYTFVYNFKLKNWHVNQDLLMYSCNYLKNNQCSIYWRRPLICRQYPHSKRIGVRPMPGCGFRLPNNH